MEYELSAIRGKCWGMKEHMEKVLNNGWKGTEQREYVGNGDEILIKEYVYI